MMNIEFNSTAVNVELNCVVIQCKSVNLDVTLSIVSSQARESPHYNAHNEREAPCDLLT